MLKSLLCVGLALAFGACGAPDEGPAAGGVPAAAPQAPTPARPADPKLAAEGDIDGRFFVSGPIGEGDLVRDSTHLYLWMEGDLAAELYHRMPVAPVPQPCEDGSAWLKQGRIVQCTADADSTGYHCYVAIDVPAETLAVGVVC